MPRNKKYEPDYQALYPNVRISNDVLQALRQSDRKIKYMECDLKQERARKDKAGEVTEVQPAREDSLDRLLEMDKQFASATPSPDQVFFEEEERREIYRCLSMLDAEDRALIVALFFDAQTEQEYAQKIGVSRYVVHRSKRRILCTLKKYFLDLEI